MDTLEHATSKDDARKRLSAGGGDGQIVHARVIHESFYTTTP